MYFVNLFTSFNLNHIQHFTVLAIQYKIRDVGSNLESWNLDVWIGKVALLVKTLIPEACFSFFLSLSAQQNIVETNKDAFI